MTNLNAYLNTMKNVINASDLQQVEGILRGYVPDIKFQGTYTRLLNKLIQPLTDQEKVEALAETNAHKCLVSRFSNEFMSTLPLSKVISTDSISSKRDVFIVEKLMTM